MGVGWVGVEGMGLAGPDWAFLSLWCVGVGWVGVEGMGLAGPDWAFLSLWLGGGCCGGGDLFFLIFSFIIVVLFGNSCYLCKKQCIKLSSVRVYRETHEEGDGSLLFLYTRRMCM